MNRRGFWSGRGLLPPHVANLKLARRSSTVDRTDSDHHPRPGSVEDASKIYGTRIDVFNLLRLFEIRQGVCHDGIFDGAGDRRGEVAWMGGDFPRAVSKNDFFAPRGVNANNCCVVLVTFDILAVVIHRPEAKYAGIVRCVGCSGQNT